MAAHRLTGANALPGLAVSRKASIHARSTGLTGLTGLPRAHVRDEPISQAMPKQSLVRVMTTTLTLLTLFKASIHAGSAVTGMPCVPDNPCKAEVR
jgi:hypothetical protein